MALSYLAKRLLIVCVVIQAGQYASAWADSQDDVSVYSRDDHLAAITSELRLLALQGNPRAQTQLAHLYADGRGVPQNYREAIEWYRRAALQRYQPAKQALESLGVPLIPEQMISGKADQITEGSSPQAGNADALPKQISDGRNIVTINIITNVVAPRGRHVDDVGGVHSAILLPRNHFKDSRHSRRRHVITKPKFRIGKSALPADLGKHQKPFPRMGAGLALSHSRGVGRMSTR